MNKNELVALFESGFTRNIVDIRDTAAGEFISDAKLAQYASMIEVEFSAHGLLVRVINYPDRFFHPVVQYEKASETTSYFAVGPGGVRIVDSDMREILYSLDISSVGGRFGEPHVEYIVNDEASYFRISFTPLPQADEYPIDYYD